MIPIPALDSMSFDEFLELSGEILGFLMWGCGFPAQ